MRVVGEAVKPMSQEDILSFEKARKVTIATHCLKLTDIKIVRGKIESDEDILWKADVRETKEELASM
ncbi:hypothetical protein Tco_0394383 [Tanacetum coccineum]